MVAVSFVWTAFTFPFSPLRSPYSTHQSHCEDRYDTTLTYSVSRFLFFPFSLFIPGVSDALPITPPHHSRSLYFCFLLRTSLLGLFLAPVPPLPDCRLYSGRICPITTGGIPERISSSAFFLLFLAVVTPGPHSAPPNFPLFSNAPSLRVLPPRLRPGPDTSSVRYRLVRCSHFTIGLSSTIPPSTTPPTYWGLMVFDPSERPNSFNFFFLLPSLYVTRWLPIPGRSLLRTPWTRVSPPTPVTPSFFSNSPPFVVPSLSVLSVVGLRFPPRFFPYPLSFYAAFFFFCRAASSKLFSSRARPCAPRSTSI